MPHIRIVISKARVSTSNYDMAPIGVRCTSERLAIIRRTARNRITSAKKYSLEEDKILLYRFLDVVIKLIFERINPSRAGVQNLSFVLNKDSHMVKLGCLGIQCSKSQLPKHLLLLASCLRPEYNIT